MEKTIAVYGAGLADAAAEFDRYLTGVNHNLSFLGDEFWTKCLWRLIQLHLMPF